MLFLFGKVKNVFEDNMARYTTMLDIENENFICELIELGIF